MTEWSPQQAQALKSVQEWLLDPSPDRQVYYLAGYAGTGKTTLARHLAEQHDGKTQFCAYTGKAALVMRNAGCEGACTIHSLIYRSRGKSKLRLHTMEAELAELVQMPERNAAEDARVVFLRRAIAEETESVKQPSFTVNEESDLQYKDLLIVDEVSMVDTRMGEDLLRFGVKTLILGDPAQLPPVFGSGFFTKREPDMVLTEIHRQAQDNPIIRLASRVRAGESLALGDYGDSQVIGIKDVDGNRFIKADQILVGRNATRHAYNDRMRKRLGYEGLYPVKGDKLLCLRNDREAGLLNGSLWRTDDCVQVDGERLMLSLTSFDGADEKVDCEAWTMRFEPDLRDEKGDFFVLREADEFGYGYALTVHKAQGSQWDDVTILDEWHQRDSRRQWLYTAITRAAKRVTVVIP